jgi:VWFA-related protein
MINLEYDVAVRLRERRWFVLIVQVGLIFGSFRLCLAQTRQPTIRSQSTAVLVPTLVKTKFGGLVFGLSARDFIVEDEGIEQSVQLDDTPEGDPISVVVAVQLGRSAALKLDTSQPASLGDDTGSGRPSGAPLSGLGTMLESYVGEGRAEVAVVTFDSQVHLLQDFTQGITAVANRLTKLRPGDDGAAILDAVLYSNRLLDRRPAAGRRVIILISEPRDHGSHVAKLEDVVRQLSASNTLVYSLSFSPGRAEFMRDAKGQNPSSAQMDLMKPLVMAINGLRKNVADSVAELTGGEYETFGDKRSFDRQMDALSGDDRNRYLLSFQPKNPRPGPHAIRVRLRDPERAAVVTARSMYWAVARQDETETGR